MRVGVIGFQVEQYRGTWTNNAMVSDIAKKTRGSTTVDTSGACSDEESWKNKYSDSMPKSANKVYTMQSTCDECR